MAHIGGIAGENIGQITDCYVVWNRAYHAGEKHLVEDNKGSLTCALLLERDDCLEIIDAAGKRRPDCQIESDQDLFSRGFAKDRWECTKGKNRVRFVSKKFYNRSFPIDKRRTIRIKTVDQYRKVALEINKGNPGYVEAHILIDADLDFKGKDIPIIARDKNHPFLGVFDGQGHMIWNGLINDKDASYVALFGYNQGSIVNVTFDGRVLSEKNAAGICGVNRGTIECCASLVRVDTTGGSASGAGIVSINEGTITMSYAVFDPRRVIPGWAYVTASAVLFILIGCLGYATISVALDADKEYVAIEADDSQQKSDEDDDEVKGDSHSVSFSLMQNVSVSRSTGLVEISLANPSSNANKLVAELLVEDSSGNYVVIARSGAILPGYEISQMKLTDEASAVSLGKSEGVVQLVPYDEKTEAKGMVELEMPVNITYED